MKKLRNKVRKVVIHSNNRNLMKTTHNIILNNKLNLVIYKIMRNLPLIQNLISRKLIYVFIKIYKIQIKLVEKEIIIKK